MKNEKIIFIYILVFILQLSMISCKKDVMSISPHGVIIEVLDNSIKITNNNIFPIHSFAYSLTTYPNWRTGCDYGEILANESKILLYEDIFGYEEGCRIAVYWWRCTIKEGETYPTPDVVEHEIVQTN